MIEIPVNPSGSRSSGEETGKWVRIVGVISSIFPPHCSDPETQIPHVRLTSIFLFFNMFFFIKLSFILGRLFIYYLLFALLLTYVLTYSEKYCFLSAIQTKHTVHTEGNERVQNVVFQS